MRLSILGLGPLIVLLISGPTPDLAAQLAPAQPASQAGVRSIPAADNPAADPKAEVVMGNARFTVLTPELVRMEWSANGKFEDHASFAFINRRMPVPKFEESVDSSRTKLIITTSTLTLRYTASGDGHFTADNLSISVTVDGKPVIWHPGLSDPQNLLGTTRTLDGARGSHTKEPIEEGLISRAGWALVDDSTRPLFDSSDFRFLKGEKSPWPWVMERPENERSGSYVDWYFFGYGHDYRKALGDFVRVAGRIPLPPRFAFGVWWSRYWAYSDQEFNDLVHGFRENDTPLDVLVIDMDWHINNEELQEMGKTDQSGQRLGWTGYTWNKLLFPDPDAFLKNLHDDGLKITMNLHPASGIQPWEQAYPVMAQAMGIDSATKKYVPFDPTDKQWATKYFDLVLHPLEKQGVDFWWLDWQQQQYTKLPGVMPTWWLNYLHFTDQQREGKRPLLFHRWGGLGNHRYQIGFSGDTVSVWDSLAFQPWFTATASNVGYAYWSHDIGGHMPGAVDPELYTRWVQFGAFSPVLRTHTTKNPDAERRIWAYPEPYSAVLRSTFQLRHALQPYLYTEARRTYDTGVAFFHPLYYDWPEDDPAYTTKNEYLFGDQMLAAPVTMPADPVSGLATEKVWLPKGNWIEWPTGTHFTGPTFVERSFSIDQIPIYVRQGAIVPMQPPMQYTGQKPVDPLIVNVWPLLPGTSSSYSVYEDSGASVDYQYGVFSRTPIKATQTGDVLRVQIGPIQGGYPGMLKSRAYELCLPDDWPPASVIVNGIPVKHSAPGKTGWSFEGNTLTTVIPVRSNSVASQVTVEVRRAVGLVARRTELDGFAGAMTRLRGVYDSLQQTFPISSAPDPLIDVMQTGDRLSYHPEQAIEEIAHFKAALPQAENSVAETAAGFGRRLNDTSRHLGGSDQVPGNLAQERERRLHSMDRAQALMQEAARQQNHADGHNQ
ncbi:MAG TPA: TIM-barrel domain-containing protein [Acidobacteriaceae bacterium]|nr:TIM-barrel domain-containing protein [Acidobacteriaceae bacterium]